jgi:GWxTD domain-containing protein
MIPIRTLTALLAVATASFTASAQSLRAEFAMARFDAPTSGPYLETYLKLKGNSLMLATTDSGRYSEVMVSYLVTKGKEEVFADAFRLNGPLLKEGMQVMDFIDQQRIALKPGKHQLTLTVRDIHAPQDSAVTVVQELTIENRKSIRLPSDAGLVEQENFYISDIQLIDTFYTSSGQNMLSKAGYDLIPYTSNFLPEGKSSLHFYCEVYNTDWKGLIDLSSKEYVINTLVENADDNSPVEGLARFVKREGKDVIPVFQSFPIDRLPTGNYNLVVELKDKKNALIERKVLFFQRFSTYEGPEVEWVDVPEDDVLRNSFVNKYNRGEELEQHVRCLAPIATQKEIVKIKAVARSRSVAQMKRFMHDFWTGHYPYSAEEEWLKYLEQVKKVNAAYSNNLNKGYETERGRVYLMYGPPDAIADSYFEPNTYPYEIWHYYRLENRNLNAPQSNRRFVFARLSGAPDFTLLHSDADNELYNARWHFELQKRNQANRDLDENTGNPHHGSRALQLYNNPR